MLFGRMLTKCVLQLKKFPLILIVLFLYINVMSYFLAKNLVHREEHARLRSGRRNAQDFYESNGTNKLKLTFDDDGGEDKFKKSKKWNSDNEKPRDRVIKSVTLLRPLTKINYIQSLGSTRNLATRKSATGKIINHELDLFGKVNVYLWSNDICPSEDKVLYWHPLFPKHPTRSYFLKCLDDPEWIIEKVGRRIIGHIHPKITGLYEFQINSRDEMEFFLFKGEWFGKQEAILKLGIYRTDRIEQDKILGQFDLLTKTSQKVFLEQGKKYPIEIFHTIINFGRMNVKWKLLDNKTPFEIIDKYYISSVYRDEKVYENIPIAKFSPMSKLEKHFEKDPRIKFYEYIPEDSDKISNTFPSCDYEPSYLVRGQLRSYYGTQHVQQDLIYPDDHLDFNINPLVSRKLNEEKAKQIALEYFTFIQKSGISDNLHLTRIAHMEENKEKNKGKRYFVELDITDKESKTKYRIGNYVYKPSKDDPLCFPKGYVWQTNIKVYLLTPLRNQFKWLQYHVENLQYIIKTVHANNLHLIVVDFNSTDGNITKLLESSCLNYTLINMGEPFNKVIGLNKGASGVNNDSIVFVLDLHLEMPLHLLDQVRKNQQQTDVLKTKRFFFEGFYCTFCSNNSIQLCFTLAGGKTGDLVPSILVCFMCKHNDCNPIRNVPEACEQHGIMILEQINFSVQHLHPD